MRDYSRLLAAEDLAKPVACDFQKFVARREREPNVPFARGAEGDAWRDGDVRLPQEQSAASVEDMPVPRMSANA